VHNPDVLMDDLIAARLAIYSQPEMQAAMPHLLAFAGSGGDLKLDQWRAMTTPILAVAAVDAGDMFMKNAYSIAELAPNGELLELKGCDHWAQYERADAFNAAALAFLA
jgi:2-hydroxy-6-oxonona-2,4-dienedioate hydrolase